MTRKKTTELDDFEPWVPRPRQVILAELRSLVEEHLDKDLDWYKEHFPGVWFGCDSRGQMEMW